MNKKLGLAVAGALLAASASAQAGITIPAGDWTVDIGGNVNAYFTNHDVKTRTAAGVKTSPDDVNSFGTGLLPAAIGIGAKTRQNDLDVAFNITFWTGTSSADSLGLGAAGNNSLNIRQAYLTFGDASWGSIKAGRDLGIFGSDAILSDMTLLGVGTGGPAGGSSTLGRIGSGYIYADWKGQMSYTSPNWNGFQFTVGAMENFRPNSGDLGTAAPIITTTGTQSANLNNLAYEGKVTYDFTGDVSGRVWLSGITQKTESAADNYTSRGVDVGGKLSVGAFGLVGYYYDGRGLDSQATLLQGLFNGNGQKSKDSGGYVQGTFAVPGIGTKLGLSYGENNSKSESGAATQFDIENKSWIVGAYHPLTKSLNLVAEYTNQDIKNSAATGSTVRKTENNTVSLGAILFF
jgi:predicted porin